MDDNNNESSVSGLTAALNGEFRLGSVTLIPAVFIIVLLLLKVSPVVALGLSAMSAGAVSFFYQGKTLQSIIIVAYNGYSTAIEEGILRTILNRGGMSSMISCSQPMAHVLTGRLMAPIFKDRKITPEIRSRCLEDSGTLGVAWAAFFPYLFLLYLPPHLSHEHSE